MNTIASQIISLTIVFSTVYSDTDQRKHQSSASLEFSAQRASNLENVSIWWRHHAPHFHKMATLTNRVTMYRMDSMYVSILK